MCAKVSRQLWVLVLAELGVSSSPPLHNTRLSGLATFSNCTGCSQLMASRNLTLSWLDSFLLILLCVIVIL